MCGGRLPGGMNKNSHIWIGRCIVAMVTALDYVSQTSMFLPKNHSQEVKINESGSRVHENQYK